MYAAHTRTGYVQFCSRTYPNRLCTPYIPDRYVQFCVHTRTVCTPYMPDWYVQFCVHTRPVCTPYIPDRYVQFCVHTRPVCTVLRTYFPDRYVHRTYPTGMYSFAYIFPRPACTPYIPDRYVQFCVHISPTGMYSFAYIFPRPVCTPCEHAALTIRTYPTGMYARGRFALAEDFGLDPTKGVQRLFSLH